MQSSAGPSSVGDGTAAATLVSTASRIRDPREPRPWSLSALWWCGTFVAPIHLLWVLLAPRFGAPTRPVAPAAPSGADDVDAAFLLRLDEVERQLRRLQRDVEMLRVEASGAPAAPPPARATPTADEWGAPPVSLLEPPVERAAAPAPPPPPLAPQPPRKPLFERPDVSAADLMGAKALAWAGGVVTLLGVVFFFVLAVNRGWIGPDARVGLGAAASVIVFTAGLWLRRRYGDTYASLAAVGTGLAGGYATLLAATALYDLLPKPAALVAAAAIAAAGLAVSLLWRSEVLAGLGLVGAMVVPALVAFDGGVTTVGTAFAAFVFAAAAAVGIRLRWHVLLVVSAVVSAPQVLALVLDVGRLDWWVVAVAAAFAALYFATGVARDVSSEAAGVDSISTGFVLGSFAIAWISAYELFSGDDRGYALLAVAAVYAAAAAALYASRERRELAIVSVAVGLTACGVGLADVLSGSSLAYTWAGEAVLLAYLGHRLRDARFLLGSLAYLLLALGHAVAVDAPPARLFEATRHPAGGAGAVAAAAAAVFAFAHLGRAWDLDAPTAGVLAWLGEVLAAARERRRAIAISAVVLGVALGAYAASLAILELFEAAWRAGGTAAAFDRGHVAVTGAWALAGLVAVAAGSRRRSWLAVTLGFVWLTLTVVKTLAYDASALSPHLHSYAFLLIGVALFGAALACQLRDPPAELSWAAGAALVVALGLGIVAAVTLAEGRWWGIDADGAALVLVALVYGAAAAAVFRLDGQRDLATLLWGLALVVAGVADALILDGTWLVLAWAVTAAALAALSAAAAEERLLGGSLAYLVAGTGLTLWDVGAPRHFWEAAAHPGSGVPAILLVAAAAAVFAAYVRDPDARVVRRAGFWAAGVLVVYAVSLGILELAERISAASVHTDFQRGHTAVSAFWGLLGLLLLYVGLARRRGALRVGGFVLFAVALSKIFLYDLPTLSSVTRALSFLAVGGVLLLGGFFYQRLSEA